MVGHVPLAEARGSEALRLSRDGHRHGRRVRRRNDSLLGGSSIQSGGGAAALFGLGGLGRRNAGPLAGSRSYILVGDPWSCDPAVGPGSRAQRKLGLPQLSLAGRNSQEVDFEEVWIPWMSGDPSAAQRRNQSKDLADNYS